MTCAIDIPALADPVYILSKFIVIPGWLLLVATLFRADWRLVLWPITQFVLPALLCLLYLLMVWDGRHGFDAYGLGTFFHLEQVWCLYQNRSALNASWLHFLALDLFAGTWMVRDGLERGMSRLLIFLCLPLTLMLAPAGLLLYFILRLTTRPKPA
jgi:hypothetical protein